MPQLAILGDTHFGARQDSPLMMSYFDRFFQTVFFPTLKERGIRTVVHTGDLGDRRKGISYSVLSYVRHELIGRLGREGIDTHLLVGNHDSPSNLSLKVNAQKELFSTVDGMREPWIYDQPRLLQWTGPSVAMIPWITDENRDATNSLLSQTDARTVLGHLELNGFEVMPGLTHVSGQSSESLKRFERVFSGHFHLRQSQPPI